MKIVTVLGARPQFVKAACVSRVFLKNSFIREVIVHTGQHYDNNMSDIFFKEMQIPSPDYNLGVNDLSHGAMTGQMLEKVEKVLMDEKPDYTLVYGDTNSTLVGALAARKLNIRLIHVEAGPRNFDLSIPEEVNRILTDRISDLLFCSTPVAIRNLEAEGFRKFPCKILKTGDLMFDAVMHYSALSEKQSSIVKDLNLKTGNYILCEFHRASNTTEQNLNIVVNTLNKISEEVELILTVHPRTKKAMEKFNVTHNFKVIDAVGYFDMLSLIKHSKMIITDSGGLQREGYVLKKNCLLLMEYTPWEELVDNGFSVTTEIEEEKIYENYKKIVNSTPDYSIELYGKGDAAEQIVGYIVNDYKESGGRL